jgi:hypothetical protein
MKHLALILALPCALAFAAGGKAQTPADPPAGVVEDEGFDLMQEGAKLLLRGLMREMEPALDEMGKALEDMQPAMRELGPKLQGLVAMIDDIRNYAAPEMLPNGDILIRRTAPALPAPPPAPLPLPDSGGEIEL